MANRAVQMPVEFMIDVCRLLGLLEGCWPSEDIKSLCGTLETQIGAKLEAWKRRERFTAYKISAPGSDEREKNRQAYLDAVGAHQDFRSRTEQHL